MTATKKTPTKKRTTKKTPTKKRATKKTPTKKRTTKKTPIKKRTAKKAAAKKTLDDFNRLMRPETDGMTNLGHLQAKRAAMSQPQAQWPWPLRPYQSEALKQFEAGKRRQGLFWHRRAGKDVFCLSMARNESRRRIGGYVHFFPKHIQAKRAIWNGVDPKKGARFVDIAFSDIEAGRNNAEMFLELYNGSTWQLLGSDNYDRLVGGNIVGAFFSEWALCDPRAWDYIRPMIRENDGFAFFITTFRSRNHAWQMAQNLKGNEDWYIDIRGVDKTCDLEGNPILSETDIEAERADGMSDAMIQQEYYCNPEATSDGAIYGKQVDNLRNSPRRQLAEWNPAKPVYCVWNFDLPVFASYLMIQPGDTPIILATSLHNMTTLGEALAKANGHRWPVQQHFVMAKHRDLCAPMSELRAMPDVLPVRNDYTTTTLTAAMLERVRIDGENCDQFLDALAGYVRRERFDAQSADMVFSPDPVMSWHGRLCEPLEAFAVWEYNGGNEWGGKPDYSQHDKAARVNT